MNNKYVMSFERDREQSKHATLDDVKAERSEQASAIEALADRFVDAKTSDPELRKQLKAAIGAELDNRERAGTLPTLPLSTGRKPVVERAQESEQTDELSR